MDGVNIDTAGEHRSIAAFDGRTGKPKWSYSIPGGPSTGVSIQLDPTGQVLCIARSDRSECDLLRMPVGTRIGPMKFPVSIGPGANIWIEEDPLKGATDTSYLVFRRGENRPILTLGTGALPTIASVFQFSADGRSLAWANTDGTIDLAELADFPYPSKPIEQRP